LFQRAPCDDVRASGYEALSPKLAEDLSMMFLHWQIASALVALAFF
jgi:hypothetical protein